jgi:hypothetical protein
MRPVLWSPSLFDSSLVTFLHIRSVHNNSKHKQQIVTYIAGQGSIFHTPQGRASTPGPAAALSSTCTPAAQRVHASQHMFSLSRTLVYQRIGNCSAAALIQHTHHHQHSWLATGAGRMVRTRSGAGM